MAFQFRHYREILEDVLSYIIGHSAVNDVNVGSVIRTVAEGFSLEMARVYVMLRSILNLFSLDKASGDDLDERALDYEKTRLAPTRSFGALTVGDYNLGPGDTALSTLAAALVSGVSTQAQIQTGDYASFPASGSIIVDRAGVSRELIPYSSKTGPDLLNLSSFPVNNHAIGETVHLSTVGADRSITEGTVARTGDVSAIEVEVTATTILYDGDYQVQNVPAQSVETGAATEVSAGTVTKWQSPPFPTATVNNPDKFSGGNDLELDAAFRARIKESQQALSSSTKLRIETETKKVELSTTGQRVITAKLIEPIAPGAMTLYINDGTSTYVPTTVDVDQTETLISVAEAGVVRAKISNWPIDSNSEQIFVSLDRGVATAVGVDSLTDTGQAWTPNQYAGFVVKDDNDVFYNIVSNTPTVLTLSGGFTPNLGPYAIFDPSATVYPTGSKLVKNTDYIINDSRGELELDSTVFPSGLTQYDSLAAYYNGVTSAYSYYDGLLQEVQRVLNGDEDDLDTYPGVIAGGSVVDITFPVISVITVAMSLSAAPGIDESTLITPVKTAVLNYINNLGIGDDVIRAEITTAAMTVDGVFDVVVVVPATNVIITDSQLAKTTLGDITVG